MLLNLLGNALKFTGPGGCSCALTTNATGTGWLLLDVEDTGIGIASQHLERISTFAQADASTTRRFGGTGLAPPSPASWPRLMGGTISVRSTVGVGTTFTVRLPAARGQPAPAMPTALPGGHCPAAHPGGGRCARQHRTAADPPRPRAAPDHHWRAMEQRGRRGVLQWPV